MYPRRTLLAWVRRDWIHHLYCNTRGILRLTTAPHYCNTLLQHSAASMPIFIYFSIYSRRDSIHNLYSFMYVSIYVPVYLHLPHTMYEATSTAAPKAEKTSLQHTATHCNTRQQSAAHCNTLQHTATHCNTLQHTATHCNTLQHTAAYICLIQSRDLAAAPKAQRTSPQHIATHCNTLQHTTTHCNTLQHTATYICLIEPRDRLQRPRHRGLHCNTLDHTATHCHTLHHTAPHCITLHHTTTHSITLQHTLRKSFVFLGYHVPQKNGRKERPKKQKVTEYPKYSRNEIYQRE